MLMSNGFTKNGFSIRKRGLSLTEIIISFAIFVIAVVPFINILMYSTKANVKSLSAIKASSLALSMSEQLKHGSSMVEVPPFPKTVYSGYDSLQWLIIEASPGGIGTSWNEYTKTIDYGMIPGYPKHKIDIAVAFYPVKSFPKMKFPEMVFDSASPPPPVANPKERPEYEKMMSRIQINVTVKWVEPDKPDKEYEFKVFTIVTKP
ncbi:MAG: hypothetical protein BWY32_03004 [bacterium ADurb.Bin243]|nr:MAG: hypothetical protein BWY32_03004 [bacterium ADurb.Bin243]HOD39718.1 hypothetical protein [Candidatus Wallbacteria bacterium]